MITLTAKISLGINTYYEVNKRNIISLETNILDRSDIHLPSYGIISNRGNLQFVDYDKKIDSYIRQKKIKNGTPVIVVLSDTLSKSSTDVAVYYAENWSYDSNNQNVTVSLTDGLEEWQSIQPPPRALGNRQSALEIYNDLKNRSTEVWDFEDLDDVTREVLSKYYIEYPYLSRGNLWSQWNKLCAACGLYLFKNRNEKIVVSYDFRS